MAARSILAIVGCVLAGCAAAPSSSSPEHDVAQALFEPFTQTIEGTAASFEMLPLKGAAADGVPSSLWIGRTEVTWDLFDVFVFGLDQPGDDNTSSGTDAIARPSKPYIPMDRGFGHAGYPAISMSHHSAEQFCEWLSAKTGRRYRLPTEQEWRQACVAGAVKGENLDAHAWHKFNSQMKSHPVASKEPGALGAFDMLGSASEWATTSEGEPVALGGSYRDPPSQIGCDVEARPDESWNASDPQIPKSIWWYADQAFVGFRLICEP